ncbi:MAG: hypothetical protein PHC88_12605 [Terrimicrobiaceae bacterium]|nr:hypothetical protein [Terrimicrobiaceae bacterium]
MKMKHVITGAALAAAIVQTTLAARLPEFLPRDQVASVLAREDAARNAAQAESVPSDTPTFYTGKIGDADSGGYLFKYRSFDSEINRWTSRDPNGFPDGANNYSYTGNIATSAVDPNGMWTLVSKPDPANDTSWLDGGYSTNGNNRTVYEYEYDYAGSWTETDISASVGNNQSLDATLSIGISNTTQISFGASQSITIGASWSRTAGTTVTFHAQEPAAADHGWKAVLLIMNATIYQRTKTQSKLENGFWYDTTTWGVAQNVGNGYTRDYGLAIYE